MENGVPRNWGALVLLLKLANLLDHPSASARWPGLFPLNHSRSTAKFIASGSQIIRLSNKCFASYNVYSINTQLWLKMMYIRSKRFSKTIFRAANVGTMFYNSLKCRNSVASEFPGKKFSKIRVYLARWYSFFRKPEEFCFIRFMEQVLGIQF